MANKKNFTIEEIANALDTTVERLSKCTTEEINQIVEHYQAYKAAEYRYKCDRILHFLDKDRPTSEK